MSDVERDISGEKVCGFRVAAYRETHPEHGDKYGHRYSEHWSTPNSRDPRVTVERMFTETQLRQALARSTPQEEGQASAVEVMREALRPFALMGEYLDLETEGFDPSDRVDLSYHGYDLGQLTVGDFEKARRAALAQQASAVEVGTELDANGEAMVCTGCGTTRSISGIKTSSKTAFSCCPERKMVPVREAITSLREALGPFVDIGPQKGAWGVISKKLDGMAPLTVTVTKAQMLTAFTALAQHQGDVT